MRAKGVGVLKIPGEMAKWANSSEDKQTQNINDESVTELDVFSFFPCIWQREGKRPEPWSVFTTVLVISTFSHWTLPCFSTLNALKKHPIRPFLPGG